MTPSNNRPPIGTLEALSSSLDLPVVLADQPLHRRVNMHYLQHPGTQHPKAFRAIDTLLIDAIATDHRQLALVVHAKAPPMQYLLIDLPTTTGAIHHG